METRLGKTTVEDVRSTLVFLGERGSVGAEPIEVRAILGMPAPRGRAARKEDDQRHAEARMNNVREAMTTGFRQWMRVDGRWFITHAGVDALEILASATRTVEEQGAGEQLAEAEERAQGLAEQLAEERAENGRLRRDLREYREVFQQVEYVRRRLRKRSYRLQKEAGFVDGLLMNLDFKDPTTPF